MTELRRIGQRMKAAVARIEAADAWASGSWQRLRTRHGWALLTAMGAVAGISAWWRLRQKMDPSSACEPKAANAQPRADPCAPSPRTGRDTALASLKSLAWGLLPALLPQIALRVLPPPWRHLVAHPWVRMGLISLLSKMAEKGKKGAR